RLGRPAHADHIRPASPGLHAAIASGVRQGGRRIQGQHHHGCRAAGALPPQGTQPL
ncbi:hypothetical protein LCGC14_2632270, partial [marine sediment metagenome]